MNEHYAALARNLRGGALNTPGHTSTDLRKAVEAQARATVGGKADAPAGDVPQALTAFVEKVARHAYKVTDRDVEALKQAGYSEDAIFELTVSAAVGAAFARLERGLAALEKSREEAVGGG